LADQARLGRIAASSWTSPSSGSSNTVIGPPLMTRALMRSPSIFSPPHLIVPSADTGERLRPS
jgi:hypothetical protein